MLDICSWEDILLYLHIRQNFLKAHDTWLDSIQGYKNSPWGLMLVYFYIDIHFQYHNHYHSFLSLHSKLHMSLLHALQLLHLRDSSMSILGKMSKFNVPLYMDLK